MSQREVRVPDAVQREALAERCTADPGPPQSVTVPGLQRTSADNVCAAALRPGHPLPRQSALAPLALIGPAQRSISLGTNLVRYSGVRRSGAGMVTPMLANRSRTAGVSTASFDAFASLCTIASAVPFGNENDPQLPQSRPERPISRAVARF